MDKAFLNYFYTKEVPQPQEKVLLEESEFKLWRGFQTFSFLGF